MKRRVITGAIIMAIMIPVIILSKYMIYPIAIALFCIIAVNEVLGVIGASHQYSIAIPSYIISAVLPYSAYFVPDVNKEIYMFSLVAVLLGFMMYLFCVMIFRKDFLTYAKVAEIFTTTTYVIVSFTALSLVRYLDNGVYCFGLIFLAAWICDTFAYITGFFFGKHKLAPTISPKKTVEGSIGGVVFAVISFVIYGLILDAVTELRVNYVWLIILGVILSVVSQIGDLLASVIKREHGVKDFGNLLPGHGGIMDRFDSVLAVATIMLIVGPVFPPFR